MMGRMALAVAISLRAWVKGMCIEGEREREKGYLGVIDGNRGHGFITPISILPRSRKARARIRLHCPQPSVSHLATRPSTLHNHNETHRQRLSTLSRLQQPARRPRSSQLGNRHWGRCISTRAEVVVPGRQWRFFRRRPIGRGRYPSGRGR